MNIDPPLAFAEATAPFWFIVVAVAVVIGWLLIPIFWAGAGTLP